MPPSTRKRSRRSRRFPEPLLAQTTSQARHHHQAEVDSARRSTAITAPRTSTSKDLGQPSTPPVLYQSSYTSARQPAPTLSSERRTSTYSARQGELTTSAQQQETAVNQPSTSSKQRASTSPSARRPSGSVPRSPTNTRRFSQPYADDSGSVPEPTIDPPNNGGETESSNDDDSEDSFFVEYINDGVFDVFLEGDEDDDADQDHEAFEQQSEQQSTSNISLLDNKRRALKVVASLRRSMSRAVVFGMISLYGKVRYSLENYEHLVAMLKDGNDGLIVPSGSTMRKKS